MMQMEKTIVTEKEVKKLLELIAGVRYGSVNIIIQDGKIVQIEKNEKLRMK